MPLSNEELVPSPCIRHCCLDERDVCLGCFRSLAEIIAWADANNADRRMMLENSLRRQEKYTEKQKRGDLADNR